MTGAVNTVVIDTNVVLDLLLFRDPATAELQAGLDAGALRWIATEAMRTELERVLGYPQVCKQLARVQGNAEAVLAAFDARVQCVEPAPRTSAICKDPDDQIFIDLAAAHGARLYSKDRAVRALRKRLAALGAELV